MNFTLGIETTCDETAVSIVSDDGQIKSDIIWSQFDIHSPYGGIVPELAARAHMERVKLCIASAFENACVDPTKISRVSVAGGPGLIGGVIVGLMAAKGFAVASGVKFIAVNHLEAHALTPRLTNKVDFPYIAILLSGGHCEFVLVSSAVDCCRLGGTVDDAPGEVFDKVAKMLGLGYPGGAIVEKLALKGNAKRFNFPRPLIDSGDCSLSFSGLKTAVSRVIFSESKLSDADKQDICASFSLAVADVIKKKTILVAKKVSKLVNVSSLVCCGGVARNMEIRNAICSAAELSGLSFIAPPLDLCSDNGAMIAWAGFEKASLGVFSNLNFAPRARWPLPDPKDKHLLLGRHRFS